MKARKYWVLTVLLTVVCSGLLWAEVFPNLDTTTRFVPHQEILTGLQGVRVLVEGLRPSETMYGLTEEALKATVELQLRQCGIKVLPPDESLSPYLFVYPKIVSLDEIAMVAGNISLELIEEVFLGRDTTKSFWGVTWNRQRTMLAGKKEVREQVLERLEDLTDMFINDYLEANPKPEITNK